MGQLGTKVANDIRQKVNSGDFTNKVVAKAGDIHITSIKRQSKRGQDASGESFRSLNPSYAKYKKEQGGSGIADLYSADNSDHALDDIFDKPNNKEFSVEFGSADQEDYMGAHQKGQRARGDFADMPVRKWFPTEDDKNSSPQKNNIAEIEEILERFINEDRTIKVTQQIR